MKYSVANEILRQLGGNMFIAMTGVHNPKAGESKLSFHIGRNPANITHCVIELNKLDYYDICFFKESIEFSRHTGVDCENLAQIFEDETGLYTSFKIYNKRTVNS